MADSHETATRTDLLFKVPDGFRKSIAANLQHGERVEASLSPNAREAIAVTDRRVIILKAGPSTGAGIRAKSFQFEQLSLLDLRIGPLGGHLKLTVGGTSEGRITRSRDLAEAENIVNFDWRYKLVMKAIAETVQIRIQAAHAPRASLPRDLALQLSDLIRLRDEGTLGGEEFRHAKARLLEAARSQGLLGEDQFRHAMARLFEDAGASAQQKTAIAPQARAQPQVDRELGSGSAGKESKEAAEGTSPHLVLLPSPSNEDDATPSAYTIERSDTGPEVKAGPGIAQAHQPIRGELIRVLAEHWTVSSLACVALLTFFFPVAAMRAPIVGDQGISGYDMVSKMLSFTKTIAANPAGLVSHQNLEPGSNPPLSLEMAWLIPTLVLAAFICAVLTLVASLSRRLALARNASIFGAIFGAAAVIYVIIVNSDIHRWLQHILNSRAKGLQDDPFAGLAPTLANAFQIRPAGGLYVLTGCLAVTAFLSQTRLLSSVGSQRYINEVQERSPRIAYVGLAGLLALVVGIFFVAHSATVPDPVAEMRRTLSVTVTDKRFVAADTSTGEFRDHIYFKHIFRNTGRKDIHAFRGQIVFRDVFGDKVLGLTVKYEEGLKSGQTKVESMGFEYNQFMENHRKMRETAFKNLRIKWIPETILFADGTKLGE